MNYGPIMLCQHCWSNPPIILNIMLASLTMSCIACALCALCAAMSRIDTGSAIIEPPQLKCDGIVFYSRPSDKIEVSTQKED